MRDVINTLVGDYERGARGLLASSSAARGAGLDNARDNGFNGCSYRKTAIAQSVLKTVDTFSHVPRLRRSGRKLDHYCLFRTEPELRYGDHMTETAAVPSAITALAKGVWWWVLLRGILAVIFGVLAIIAPAAALSAIAIVFGAYAIVDGAMAIGHGIHVRKTDSRWGWLVAQGVIAIIAGVLAVIFSGLAGLIWGLFILWTIVFWNVITGIASISSVSRASGSTKTWGILIGVLSIAFGVLLAVLVWVTPGATVLGLIWIVGIYAIIFGVMLVVAAIQVRAALARA